jgi:hypothetical protein
MSLKRKIAITGSVIFLFSLLLVGLLIGAYFYLPFYLESKIIPQLAAGAGLSDFSVSVRNIGFFNADLGALRIGPRDDPAIEIRSIRVDYSPRSLYQRKIKKMAISGIELHSELSDGRFKLQGVDIEKIMAGAGKQPKAAPQINAKKPPVILEKLEISDSRVIISANDQNYHIPFEIELVPQDPEYKKLVIEAYLYPRGERLSAKATVDRMQRRVVLSVESAALDLERFADISARAAHLAASGDLTLQAKADIRWEPLQVSSFNASLTLQHGKIKGNGFQLQTAMGANNEPLPFRIDLSAKDFQELIFSGSSLALIEPAPLTLVGFDGIIKKNGAAIESGGKFSAVLQPSTPSLPDRLPVKIKDSLPLHGQFSAIYHQSGKWQCDVSNVRPEGSAAGSVSLTVDSYAISSSIPEFSLSAKAESHNIEAAYRLITPAVRITSGSETITIPEVSLKGTAQLDLTANDSTAIKFDLQAPNIGIKLKEGNIKIPKLALSGKLNRDANRQISIQGLIQFSGAGGRFSRLGARISGVRGKIPFKWPVKGKTTWGSVAVAGLKYKDLELGSVSSQLHQTATGFLFKGRHQNSLLPRVKINFSGESKLFHNEPAGAVVRVEISRPAAAPELDLGKFYPKAKGMRIKGKFQMKGDLALNMNSLDGNVRVDLKNGTVMMGEKNLELEGIHMSLNFPELPKIRSAPGQQIDFARISLGEFVAHKGSIKFQIESAQSVLIEKMHFLWCGGNVETQSMRLIPGVEEYHVTFYCDRLNLAQVLEQFGAGSADGQGTVNGRIPIKYEKGKIHFDDGFLFSTPGEGNKIHLTGTDILTAGIPPNTPQYVQMELAREALKDYDYSWAKLNITSKGEELLLQMKMDGKPAQTLPFVYNKDIGGFMKIEANAKGSKFQGIRLDVNFRLPLNKLLQYKEILNMIQ